MRHFEIINIFLNYLAFQVHFPFGSDEAPALKPIRGSTLLSSNISNRLKLPTFISVTLGHICIEFCKDVIFLKTVV